MANLRMSGNDLALSSNPSQLQLATDLETIDQSIRSRLSTIRGEHFLNTRLGVDYRELAWRKAPLLDALKSDILRTISQTRGVLRVVYVNLDLTPGTRTLTVDFKAITSPGPIEGSVPIKTP